MEKGKAERSVYAGEDDQGDEEKMEKFFSLIRNFHEARNRRREELNQSEEKKKKKMRMIDHDDHDDSEKSSWVPKFEWQDFTEEIQFRKPPAIFPKPCNRKEEKKQQENDDALDLKLTL